MLQLLQEICEIYCKQMNVHIHTEPLFDFGVS
jgi:hypothetical protein